MQQNRINKMNYTTQYNQQNQGRITGESTKVEMQHMRIDENRGATQQNQQHQESITAKTTKKKDATE